MKAKVLASAAIATAIIAPTLLFGSDSALGSKKQFRFSVVYIDEINNRGEKALIRSRATKSRVAEIQAELAADRALTSKLYGRGIQIRNIVGRDVAMDGSAIFYVR